MDDVDTTYRELLALREQVLDRVAFDLFQDSQFLEHWVCYVCSLEPASEGKAASGYTDRGEGVCVRSTSLSPQFIEGQYVEKLTYLNLWHRPEDTGLQDDRGIKVFVFVARFEEELRFLVIPSVKLREKRDLEIFIRDGDSEWLRYEADPDRLKEAVEHRAKIDDEEVPQLKLFN